MAITYKLVEANTSRQINLVYDKVSNQNYAMYTGSHALDSPLDARFHTPDDAPAELISLIAGIRPLFFRTIIQGKNSSGQNSPDDVANNIATLARWIDGPDQQAARYQIYKNCNRIELHVAIDGASKTTILPVVYGNTSTFAAFFNEFGEDNQIAFGAPVSLFLAPAGEGEPYTLRNDLASAPFMQEDSNSDGLADGLNLVGTPTVSLSTAVANYLFGGKSQLLGVNSSSQQGVFTDNVTASIGTDAVGKFLVSGPKTNADPLTLTLRDGSANIIDTAVFNPVNPSGYDRSYTADGRTWYEYRLDGRNTTAANFRLQMVRQSADAANATNYLIQALYLEINQTAHRDGWCSTSALQNRRDPTATNRGRINYLDVWGIPGDVDALVEMAATFTTVTDTPNRVHVSRIYDTSVLAADRRYWFDTLTGGAATGGSWSTPSDAARSGGSYLRFTASSSGASGLFSVSLTNDDGLRKFVRWPSRIYALTRTNNIHADTGIEASALGGGASIIASGAKHTVANTWEWIDLGLLNPADAPLEKANTGGTPTLLFSIDVQSASGTLDIDAIVAVPVAEDGFLVGVALSFSVSDIFYLLPKYEQFFSDNTASIDPFLGECWTCKAGPLMSRYILNISGVNNAHNLTDAVTVALTITPRTRHIMGTQ